ncbi:hypothetical protein TNCV_3000591 [Trichonephila clavipes]|nr:hypothetical protein TNCV_3000591 [Trichonephila clavipes]
MSTPYHPGIKARADGIATHILSSLGQSQTNAVKAQDYKNSVLSPTWCFAGGLCATRNNDQLRCLLRHSTESPKSIAKQTVRNAVKSSLAEIVEVEIEVVSPSIVPSGSFTELKSHCHLYGAQGQRQAYLLPMPR